MVDFLKLLSPAQVQRLEKVRSEMRRIHGLPDRWLAEELLRLARRTREEFPDKLSEPVHDTHDTSLVWEVGPEIARRLGATLRSDESRRGDVRYATGQELRTHAGSCLQYTSVWGWLDYKASSPSAAELLTHEIANGNPVAIALDRLYPVGAKDITGVDHIARSVGEVSKRRGFGNRTAWWPGMQEELKDELERG